MYVCLYAVAYTFICIFYVCQSVCLRSGFRAPHRWDAPGLLWRLLSVVRTHAYTHTRNLSGGRKWPAVVKSYLASVSVLGCHVTRVRVCERVSGDRKGSTTTHCVRQCQITRARRRACEHARAFSVCGIINACQRFDAIANIVIV